MDTHARQVWLVVLLTLFSTVVHSQDWPRHQVRWVIKIEKDINSTPAPHEPSDKRWLHLHRNHPTLPDALENTIAPLIASGNETLDPSQSGLELRYTVHGIPVSDWLPPPFRFVLKIDNSKQGNSNSDTHFGPGIVYVDPAERNHRGYPLDPEVQAWREAPGRVALYQEAMAPHTELFHAVQMWWDHPAHADAPFVRGLTPQHGEDHRQLRVRDRHERFPMADGPRGIGWMSPYVSGQVDSRGRFAFAEAGGRVGYVSPDGEIITVAGWRVSPDQDPIRWGKPIEQVRRNMENRANWLGGRGEFLTPLDVAIDPSNEDVWYVADQDNDAIRRIDRSGQVTTLWLPPDGWGRRESTNQPHYGWLVAVDPRGAVLLAGGGEHGFACPEIRWPVLALAVPMILADPARSVSAPGPE